MKCHKEDAPLLGLMGQSMRLIGKRAQELYAEYDLNRAQSGILFALHQEDSMSQKELAKRLNVTPPSITSMIKKMEQEGYITRKADEQDQRVMRLTLAQKGKDCIDYVIKTAEKLEEIVFEGMTAEEKKYRILGIILAAVTYAVIIVAMILTRISASSEQNSQIKASENKTQIAFDGEEYVEFGDIPEPNLDDGEPAANDADNEPASDGSDQTNEGNPGDGEALVSSRHDSPMETPKKKKTGPTAAELKKQKEEQARIKKEKEQQEKEKNKINNRASNAFNRTGGNRAGHSGSPNGNASTGAVSGVPGHNLGTNYRLNAAHFSCAKSGELQFSITVRKAGAVTSVTYVRGTGEAAGDKNVRRQFEQRTRNLRFTVTGDNAPNEKRGVITWKIK